MVFKNDFVVSLKVNGKILREFKDQVQLPFGSEYSILLKNLRAVNAVANVSIDGKDVLNGNQLIVPANQAVELERFLSDNGEVGFRFKFIEKTLEVSAHRGNYVDDGIIRVAYTFEAQKAEKPTEVIHEHHHHNYPIPYWVYSPPLNPHTPYTPYPLPTICEVYSTTSINISDSGESINSLLNNNISDEAGITARGSVSNQVFCNGGVGALEVQTHVITFKLVGQLASTLVKEPVLVKTKIVCENCGRKCKSHLAYCPGCGTNMSTLPVA